MLNFSNKKINIILCTGILISTFGGLLGIFIPLQLRSLIDTINRHGSFSINGIVIIISLFLAQTLFTSMGVYITSRAGESYVAAFRKRVFKHILQLRVSFFDTNKSGELASRVVNDTATIRSFLTQALPTFISSLIIFGGSIVALFILDWKLSLLLTIALPSLMAFIMPLGNLTGKYSKEIQEYLSRLTGLISESFSQIRVVKANRAENSIDDLQSKEVEQLFNTSVKSDFINSIINPIVFLFLFGLVALIFGYGGMRVQSGTLTIGTLVSFIVYLFQIINPVNSIVNFANDFKIMKGATEKINELANKPVEFGINQLNSKKVKGVDNYFFSKNDLTLNNLYLSFKKSVILDHVNMVFKAGKKTAIVGPSGAGKTTILNVIERFYTPQSGSIKIGTFNAKNFSIPMWRKQFSMVLQESSILTGTIRENLIMGLDHTTSDKQLYTALKNAYLISDLRKWSNGLDTYIGEKGIKLSGGQRQRLQLARVFLQHPKIIILDEATSSLDSESEEYVSRAIKNIMDNTTIIVVAHRLSTVVDADNIYFLDGGKVSGEGTHEELLKTHKKYRKYVKDQFINNPVK